jgi:hypothetical protein
MPRRRKDVSEAQRNSIKSWYEQGQGLKAISLKFGHNMEVIRRVLVEMNVTIRPVGHPRKAD